MDNENGYGQDSALRMSLQQHGPDSSVRVNKGLADADEGVGSTGTAELVVLERGDVCAAPKGGTVAALVKSMYG